MHKTKNTKLYKNTNINKKGLIEKIGTQKLVTNKALDFQNGERIACGLLSYAGNTDLVTIHTVRDTGSSLPHRR